MKLLQHEKLSPPSPCHYIKGKNWRFRYFFACNLDEDELEEFLSRGWRKFGYYYFRPDCEECCKCIPIRIKANDFKPSKSHKRILKKSNELSVHYGPLIYSEQLFELYKKHSRVRFNQEKSDEDEFISSFFARSCPSFLSEYYYNNRLIGAGFLDKCRRGLSSVYYIFDTDYSSFSPGTFSILSEINHAAELNLSYYYLGYYIEECSSMAYKGRFLPYELYNWDNDTWATPETLINADI